MCVPLFGVLSAEYQKGIKSRVRNLQKPSNLTDVALRLRPNVKKARTPRLHGLDPGEITIFGWRFGRKSAANDKNVPDSVDSESFLCFVLRHCNTQEPRDARHFVDPGAGVALFPIDDCHFVAAD